MKVKPIFFEELESLPPILDFEASSLSDCSYPIACGLLCGGWLHYWVIKPEKDWIDWSLPSQAIHGLSRSHIIEVGEKAKTVFDEIQQVLKNEQVVYSDCAPAETIWMRQLGTLTAEFFDVKTLLKNPLNREEFKIELQKTFVEQKLKQHNADEDALAIAITVKNLNSKNVKPNRIIDEKTVHPLNSYPLLKLLASQKTDATHLDARTCRHLYESANIDKTQLSANEKLFYESIFAK